MAILDDVKLSLRIKTTLIDTDINDLIEACKTDLEMAGVINISDTDALTKQAIKLYCKANIGSQENSEKVRDAYEALKISMSLCGDYTEAVT